MHFPGDKQQGISGIVRLAASHGAVCLDLADKNGLILLPGRLDMELFSHQLARSTGSTVIFQFSANSSSLAFETLNPYLQ
jgi:alpha-D-ribose 1-methylphosphonate 5-triphosphate synthase subunit PhnH